MQFIKTENLSFFIISNIIFNLAKNEAQAMNYRKNALSNFAKNKVMIMTILNLTQHAATPEQIAQGVGDLNPHHGEIQQLKSLLDV